METPSTPKEIFVKKLLIAVAVSAIASSSMAFTISVGDQSEFRPVGKSYQKTGTPISHESMNLMRDGIDKSSVYDVLGVPHYGTGVFPAKKWEYRFDIVNPDGITKDCQTLVGYKDGLVETVKVSSQKCLDSIAYKASPSVERVVERVIEGKVHLPVRSEVHFAFNKYQSKDVTNDIDWKSLADNIIKDNAKVVRLIGYTDTKGSYVYNLELASKRSDTVFTNLVKHGVDPKIIEINNLGKSQSFNERKVQITW